MILSLKKAFRYGSRNSWFQNTFWTLNCFQYRFIRLLKWQQCTLRTGRIAINTSIKLMSSPDNNGFVGSLAEDRLRSLYRSRAEGATAKKGLAGRGSQPDRVQLLEGGRRWRNGSIYWAIRRDIWGLQKRQIDRLWLLLILCNRIWRQKCVSYEKSNRAKKKRLIRISPEKSVDLSNSCLLCTEMIRNL